MTDHSALFLLARRVLPTMLWAICCSTLASCGGASPNSGGAAPSELFRERVANATYRGIFNRPIRLVDGRFEGRPYAEDGSSRPSLELAEEPRLLADLTGDGVDDAVVLLHESRGGSGTWMHLAVVVAAEGGAESLASVPLGDRVQVRALGAGEDRVVADLVEHGPADPLCCPTREVRRQWTLEWGRLVQGERRRGHLVWGHEVRSFTPCGASEPSWVVDETGGELAEVYRELAGAPYERLFVEVRASEVPALRSGFGADLARALAIHRLQRAEAEGVGCGRDLSGYEFRVFGNEPFWSVEIGDRIIWSPMDGRQEEFPRAPAASAPGAVVFDSKLESQPVTRIRVELEPVRCVDSMSGSRYGWTGRVMINGKALLGCALQGGER